MGNGLSHADQGVVPKLPVEHKIHAEITESRYSAHTGTSFASWMLKNKRRPPDDAAASSVNAFVHTILYMRIF